VRAALEGICYQTRDVFEVMTNASSVRVNALRVDGGAVQNDFLMQFQADVLGTRVQRPVVRQTTSLGVAFLAGLKTGMWASLREVEKLWAMEREFVPTMKPTEREKVYRRWKEAVKRSRSWAANRSAT
jgi:glycerol kinase